MSKSSERVMTTSRNEFKYSDSDIARGHGLFKKLGSFYGGAEQKPDTSLNCRDTRSGQFLSNEDGSKRKR